ncbi:hypothetical protein O6H91_01G031300 [Diphasiastrum complanatum]|uniref:Uncharacterized protein n=2 Tax=Diphasiastrum complanatum TaxID=34168 RepID=A0ACC2EPN2_DIPCM|nr:hypothetical protein O6H91_01G031300 [Diphasiastrum complanatum]KAJ7568408.1 hypothetical protein O6H91_01G031300 [Diphasiastrum complanatum]
MVTNEGDAVAVQTQRGELSPSTYPEKQVSSSVAEFREHGGSALKEHDYFAARGLQKKQLAREELDLNLSETELRLGPPPAASSKDGDNKEDLQSGSCASPRISKNPLDQAARLATLQDHAKSIYLGRLAAEKPLKTVDRASAMSETFLQQQQQKQGILEREVGDTDFQKEGRNFSEKPQNTSISGAHERSALAEASGSTAQEISASSKFLHPDLTLDKVNFQQSHDFQQGQHSHQTALEMEQARAAFDNFFAGGKLIYPIPVNALTASKRGFVDNLGRGSADGRTSFLPNNNSAGKAAANTLPAAEEAEVTLLPQKLQLPSSGSQGKPGIVSSFTSWKMGLELVGGSFGPFPSPGAQPYAKADPDHVSEPAPNLWASHSKTAPKVFPSARESTDMKPEHENSSRHGATVSPNRAPVGWPPVQSFRKNSLPAPHLKSVAESEDKPASGSLAAAPSAMHNKSHPLFVKVYMDGLAIGRKVDLKIHNSYNKLSATLEEMFRRYLNASHQVDQVVGSKPLTKNLIHCEGKNLNFLCGSEYVITYEDNDGDLMLVGDVPWGTFEEKVKRLRIMKGCEAIGRAPRAPDKIKKGN